MHTAVRTWALTAGYSNDTAALLVESMERLGLLDSTNMVQKNGTKRFRSRFTRMEAVTNCDSDYIWFARLRTLTGCPCILRSGF